MLTEIVLTFNTFDVEYHEDCDYDYLEASTFLSGIEIYARSVPQDMNLATN